MELQNITATLARHLVLQDGAREELEVHGIRFQEWPDDIAAKEIFKKYYQITETKKHEAARYYLRVAVEELFEKHGIVGLTRPMSVKECLALYPEVKRKRALDDLVNRLSEMKLSGKWDKAEQVISEFQASPTISVKTTDVSELGEEFFTELERLQATNSLQRTLPDFPILSETIGGFNPGRFTILFADTGFGKTNIALHFALSASKLWSTIYFNMEMTPFDFLFRTIVAASGETYREMPKKVDRMVFHQLFHDRKLKITPGNDLNVQEIAGTIIREKRESGAEFFVVDYDQKIILADSDEPEWKQIQRAAVYLERVAIRENVHVLLLVQSNFEGGISSSKRMMYGAYTVMRFHNVDGKDVIECVKNRGGETGAAIEVVYDRSRAWVKEVGRTKIEKHKPHRV
jgi:KaiC/GvpD/RAD55 family RecA-like ATPase